MKVRKRYTFTLEDESRLEKLIQISASRGKYIICGVAVLIIFMTLGALTVGLSPARRLLPGYLKDSERAATQEHHMRLDSLQQAYEANNAYLSNIIAVMNPTTRPARTLPDSAVSQIDTPFSPDSLFPTSVEERNFLSMMREQEKYNISVIAPLAAESMLFAPVNDESIISEKSKKSKKAEVILAKGSQVAAIADSVREKLNLECGVKPFNYEGYKNCQWIVIDYGYIMVHVFLPEVREFYSLESLWEDAPIEYIEDTD